MGLLAQEGGSLLAAASDEIYRITLDDSDGDGIPDSEEHGSEVFLLGADDRLRDNDLDGHSNTAEHVFGSAPDSRVTMPSLNSAVRHSAGAIALNLPTVPGTAYRIEGSEDLIEWRPVTEFTAGPFRATLQVVHPEFGRTHRYFRAVAIQHD
jgi:hypothetical protein